MRFNLPCLATMAAAAALASSLSHAAPVPAPLERAALNTVEADHRVLLGVARAGSRLVAVGERGLILLSDDDGKSWRQANVPVATTLTADSFATPKAGWAVGHAGVVLHTEDGGVTWSRQLDGIAIGQLLTEAAKASAASGNADAERMTAVARQFVGDGPDKPFLDLHFSDERNGILVGAYGLILRTEDGGKSWQSMMERVDNPKGLHLYAISMRGDAIWLAGEQGFLARSVDGGKTFAHVESPYRGSYFTLTELPDGEIIVGGLKGNVFRSVDHGARFDRVEGFFPVSLSASAVLKDGRIVFSNQAGQLFVSADQGRSVTMLPQDRAAPLNAVSQADDGSIVVAGVRGITRLTSSASSVAAAAVAPGAIK
jgi:photosystem II stability/assembly factor-like uncharacterized protein